MRTTPKVTLRPCDQRGRVADDATEATGGGVVTDGAESTEVQQLVREKYGLMVTVIKVLNSIHGLFKKEETQSNCSIVITLD